MGNSMWVTGHKPGFDASCAHCANKADLKGPSAKPLTPQQVMAIDAGEMAALEGVATSVGIYVHLIEGGTTRTQALQTLLQGLYAAAAVPQGAKNIAAMHAAAVAKLGDQALINRGQLHAEERDDGTPL